MAAASKNLRPQNLKLALRASSGLVVGQIYPLLQPRNIMGRSLDVAVALEDSRVSRKHASVDIQNGFHFLVDLGSINGTFLNGKKIAKAVTVQPGDEVRVGSTVFKVELLDQVKSHAGLNWREATRAIAVSDIARDAPIISELSIEEKLNATGARWMSLIDLAPRGGLFSDQSRKWMSAFIAVSIVAAALWFSWH